MQRKTLTILCTIACLLFGFFFVECGKKCPQTIMQTDTIIQKDTVIIGELMPNSVPPSQLWIEIRYTDSPPYKWKDYRFSLRDIKSGLYSPFESACHFENKSILFFGAPKREKEPMHPDDSVSEFWFDGSFIAELSVVNSSGIKEGSFRFRVQTYERTHSAEIMEIIAVHGFRSFRWYKDYYHNAVLPYDPHLTKNNCFIRFSQKP